MSEAMAPVPTDHPLMKSWKAYQQTPDYENTRKWAAHSAHLEGSLWAAFEKGWQASGGDKILCSWCGHETLKVQSREALVEAMTDHMLKCEKSPFWDLVIQKAAIDELRHEEGASVEITCANPEGSGPDNEQVIVTSDWTNWQPRTFRGRTLQLALADALKEKELAQAK